MIIIQLPIAESKKFLDALSAYESNAELQKAVQDRYTDECFAFEKKLQIPGHGYPFLNGNTKLSISRSSNKRTVIIDKNRKVKLQLYRIRAMDSPHYEDILMEPFYPGTHASLVDVYGILRERPYSRDNDAYAHSSTHTRAIRRNVKAKISTILPSHFKGGILDIDTYEEFYELIHTLTSEQLRSLFGTDIIFFKGGTNCFQTESCN